MMHWLAGSVAPSALNVLRWIDEEAEQHSALPSPSLLPGSSPDAPPLSAVMRPSRALAIPHSGRPPSRLAIPHSSAPPLSPVQGPLAGARGPLGGARQHARQTPRGLLGASASPATLACVAMMPRGAGCYLPLPLQFLVDETTDAKLDIKLLVQKVSRVDLSAISPEAASAIRPSNAWTAA
ncbi:hypothetical protein T484DRAFT_1913780 [Baffinella frigidus]|nr:hypothetical protein T484DRAFT_1913780 [Cryptophyta sp. CCMP2293]